MQDIGGANAAGGLQPIGYPHPSDEATIQMNPQAVSYNVAASVDPGSTLPLPKGNISRRKESDDIRVVTIVTLIILVATFLLIGFSVYLLGALGFITLPGVQSSAPTPTLQPTPAHSTVSTATVQPTSQPTVGGTPTPTQQLAPIPTPRPTPSPTPTAVPTPTPTPVPTPTPTPKPTPTATLPPPLP